MTLDEAIKHCQEVAQEKRYEYQECLAVHDMEDAMECGKCGEEHRQLARWLRDYKRLKEQELEWIPIVKKALTDKEKAEYLAESGEELCYMLENEMPLDGQEVLVSVGKFVLKDIFDEDFYNFKKNDIKNVDAWMPLPKSYESLVESKKHEM